MDKCTKNFSIQIGIIFILNLFFCFLFNSIHGLIWVLIATCVAIFNNIFFMQKKFKILNVINWLIYLLFIVLVFYVGSQYGGDFDVFPYPAFILSAIALVITFNQKNENGNGI